MTHRTRFIFLVLMITIGMPVAANSAIKKCVGNDGKVVFSDQPCSTGQAATTIQAPAKPLPSSRKPVVEDGAPSTDHSRPIVLAYDTLCAEDKRLYVRDSGKLSPEDRGMRKERLDKSCNPQMRLAAVEQDKENLV